MVMTTIDAQYRISIPKEFQKSLLPGQEVAVSIDAQGRLVVTPAEQIKAILKETFGMWANRTDLPEDNVEYVNQIRKGNRLDQVRPDDETD
ncbi:MAG: hypothetical protein Fur0022_11870 [Anaerolineales bacterium]